MVEKLTTGKNQLWDAYQNADPLVKDEILLEIKKIKRREYFYHTCTKDGFELPDTKNSVKQIFLRLLPETAPLFGLPVPKTASAPKPKAISNQPTLFE